MNGTHVPEERLVLLAEGEASPEEAREAEAHLRACPGCAAALEAWGRRAGGLRALGRRFGALRDIPPLAPPRRPRSVPIRAARWIAAAAAIVGFAIAVRALLAPPRSPAVVAVVGRVEWVRSGEGPETPWRAGDEVRSGAVLETGAARMGVRTNRGAAILVDRETALSWPAADPDWIRLNSGRILAAKVPAGFTVHTGQGSVVDLGTSFLVEAGAVSASVLVIRGRVRTEPPGGVALDLGAGERRALAAAGRAETLAPDALDAALAWARDAAFPDRVSGETLGSLLDRLGEVSPLEIEAPEELRRQRIAASLRGLSSDGIVEALARAAGATIRRSGRRIVLAPGPGEGVP